MSFVAHPYERFADDLLTALTGGVSREEHVFLGPDIPYGLAAAGTGATNIRVYGQRDDAFVVFDPSLDYRYDLDQQAIVWRPEGRSPDDRSHFYVSYDPLEAVHRLTDRNPGSVNSLVAATFARQYAVFHKQLETVYHSAFVDLATGSALDHVAALLGIERRDARFAGGEVLFTRGTPAPGDITISSGTLVSTDQGQNFETIDKRTLRRGQLSVLAPIRAQAEGPAGRVDVGAIRNVNRPIFGVEGVVNEAPTAFATDKETDEALRRRIKATLERAGKSTLDAIKYGLIEDLPEITETNVQVVERPETPGLVEVKLGLGAVDDPALVRRVEEAIFASRAAGIRVTHNLPTRTITAAEQAATRPLPRGANPSVSLPPDVLQREAEGTIAVRVEVLVRLVERNLTAAEKERIEDELRSAIVTFLDSLPMGADLIFNKLLGRIAGFDDVADALLVVGSRFSDDYRTNLAADGRKLVAGEVTVALMDEPVRIAARILLEPRPEWRGDPEVATGPLPSVQAATADAVQRVLATVRGTLAKATLVEAIRAAITEADDRFQLVATNPVVLRVEYAETGRLLVDPTAIDLADHHLPELADLSVEVPGALDG